MCNRGPRVSQWPPHRLALQEEQWLAPQLLQAWTTSHSGQHGTEQESQTGAQEPRGRWQEVQEARGRQEGETQEKQEKVAGGRGEPGVRESCL